MPQFFEGLTAFREFCDEQALTWPERLLQTAGIAKMIMEKEVKATYGDDKVLAPNTDTTKSLRPDGGAGGPLYIDGSKLRDSIESHHGEIGLGAAAAVGSSEPVVVYQEHGFVTSPASMIPNKVVPPRPAFAIGVYKSLGAIREVVRVMLNPSARLRTLAGKFASLSNPERFMSNAGDIKNAINPSAIDALKP